MLLALILLILWQSVSAASANLVWWPYLQQVTDTGVVILWTTQTGSNPVVRYAGDIASPPVGDAGYSRAATGTTRPPPLHTHLHRVE